jgi:hypothetical protein
MRRLSLIASLAVTVALVASSVGWAQRGGGGMGRGGGMGGGGGRGGQAGARQGGGSSDRIAELLEPLGLPAEERAAAEKALAAKGRARQALRQDLDKLREMATDKEASREELARAVDRYTRSMERYHAAVRSADRALSARLSARGRAVCLAAGVLDNAMGMGSRSRGGGGGAGGGGRGMGGGGRGAGGGGRGMRGGRGGGR